MREFMDVLFTKDGKVYDYKDSKLIWREYEDGGPYYEITLHDGSMFDLNLDNFKGKKTISVQEWRSYLNNNIKIINSVYNDSHNTIKEHDQDE